MLARRFLTIPSLLSGKPVLSSVKIPVLSHKSEIIHHYLPLPDLNGLDQICEDAYTGFTEWSQKPYTERSAILNKAADSIEKDLNTFIDAHVEIGATRHFASIIANNAVNDIREYARTISRPDGNVTKLLSADLAITLKLPLGPVLSIAPWNAPTILWARAIFAPLAAGCSVIMKSSEKSPKVPYLFTKHLLGAGVDAQALQLINVGPADHSKVTESLLSHDLVRKVNFTGSTAVGTKIAEMAAKHLKPVLLELGGKNVSVVCKDADLDKAAFSLILSAWMHKGQVCMCVDNVYIHESIYAEFVEKLKTIALDFAASPDMEVEQRDKAGAQKIGSLVDDAIHKGAKIVFGEQTNTEKSITGQYSPLILGGVTPEMGIYTEEIFGPVLSVFKFESEQELITQLNKSRYGLKASVWSTNTLHALDIAKRLEFGGVHINGSTVHDEPTVPHGGVKLSGTGRFNSHWGVDEFTYTKAITIN